MVKNKQIDTGNVNEPNVDQKKKGPTGTLKNPGQRGFGIKTIKLI